MALAQETAGSIRLHHFWNFMQMPDAAWQSVDYLAFIGVTDQAVLRRAAYQEAAFLIKLRDELKTSTTAADIAQYRYTLDRIWNWPQATVERMMLQQANRIGRLALLGPETVIELNMFPDPLCDTCAVGDHCPQDDISDYGGESDVVGAETTMRNELIYRLDEQGFVEGADYEFGVRQRELRSADGTSRVVDTPYLRLVMRAAHVLVQAPALAAVSA